MTLRISLDIKRGTVVTKIETVFSFWETVKKVWNCKLRNCVFYAPQIQNLVDKLDEFAAYLAGMLTQ